MSKIVYLIWQCHA